MTTLSDDQRDTIIAAATSGSKEAVARAAHDAGVAPIQQGPPSLWARNLVWLIFIGGMLAVLAILVLGVVLKSSPAESIVTLATAIVTGLFALFAPSPLSGSGGGTESGAGAGTGSSSGTGARSGTP